MEDKEKEELISSDDEKSNSSSKLIAFIIIAFFIFSVALVIIAIIVYLSKDKSLSELEVYKKYEKQEKIKLGDDRIVYKAKNKETNEPVAIKEIKLKTTDIRNKVEKDIKFMNASNHLSNESNETFQLIEVFEQRSTKFIVTEYYDEDLSIALNKTEKGFDIGLVKRLVNTTNRILQGLRGFNVVYNNIKLENIIVQMAGDMIKLTDFSEAKLLTNDKNDTKENEWGITPVLGDINEEKGDLYNIGKEIYRMLFKKTDKKNEEMIKDIKEKFNNTELSDLMGKLLVEDAKERISWDDYFNHTFFA